LLYRPRRGLNRATPQATRNFVATAGDLTPGGVEAAAHLGVRWLLAERPLAMTLRRRLRWLRAMHSLVAGSVRQNHNDLHWRIHLKI
jgi:hypothetical protein